MHPDRIASIMSGNPNFSVGSSHFTTASCIVFVGNIPYGLAENQLTDIFNSVGRVVCFRMVFDRETGRSKGYGFAEYIDAETAASAVRNLDSFEIMGRKLRVDYSSQGYVGKEGYPGRTPAADNSSSSASASNPTSAGPKDQNSNNGNSNGNNGMYPEYTDVRSTYTPDGGYTADTTPVHTPTTGRFPIPTFTGSDATTPSSLSTFLASLPAGTDAHPNLSTTDSISKTLAAVPPPQLLTALVQMKDLVASDPLKATETLRYCPQLTHALFQAMVMMNLVKPEVVSQLLETGLSGGALPLYGNQMGGGFQQGLLQQQQQYMQQQQQIRQTTPQQQQQQQQQQAGFYGYASQQQQPALGLGLGEFAAGQQQQQEFMSQQQQQQMQQQIQVVQQMQAAQQIQQIQAAQAALQGAQDAGAEDKVLLLQRVKLLTQEEISRLPAEQAQQVLLLKHKLLTEGMGGQAGF